MTDFYRSPGGRLFNQFIAEGQSDPGFLALFRERFLYARRDAARVMWRRGVERGEIRKEIDSEIVLDLIYGPDDLPVAGGHGSLSGSESEAMVATVFGGLREPGYRGSTRRAGLNPPFCSKKNESLPLGLPSFTVRLV